MEPEANTVTLQNPDQTEVRAVVVALVVVLHTIVPIPIVVQVVTMAGMVEAAMFVVLLPMEERAAELE